MGSINGLVDTVDARSVDFGLGVRGYEGPAAAIREQPCTVPLLSVRGLRASFDGRVVVDDVGFDIRSGEAYGLVGPAGAGKSTTVRIVSGLLSDYRGSVMVRRKPIATIGDRALRESVGYVQQCVVMVPSATVGETIRFWARFLDLPAGVRRERAADVLAAVGLRDQVGERVDRCSGGVLRELSLAVALLHRPRLLVLDHPTAGIDPTSRVRLLQTLRGLREEGVSLLYASRDLDEVRQVCDRFGLLHNGYMVAEGATRDLSSAHA
ncbi:ABC-2 type transport system ATP-binding protein/lipooligosaccharide transport system ATP-binding protein [Actinokineospora alba]|uniref:ABC-2 type transport system ATP-binding protein/lipooligosaccharide transport system ATP-binding protein n=1 Tax=Actinokineospora alba TaxID=504798 RepID=A0A1H0M634_9PSEU|nr:ABC transporter ATP-binding protein [Actinokineospora alba]TDP67596.1 ABC-2 type transport system ATP-binding protein/lipooligosaccharide transport system ATP-binding protein [Actinokineospora alba]SDI44811.1 ABC-2 type transport system ATP-binding protein/lipooligosaccharide transport system ATP-binding protein [Actinokineospora alba]SDO75751.1 ABC-2 type transport system ATP-binding protein/lipooligosaccharide transport system ATP-binding protein [Actinokineospora alba]